MRDRIAALLRLAPGQISVKATTTERLGFAGRGEGIAAQAIATIRIPGEDVMTKRIPCFRRSRPLVGARRDQRAGGRGASSRA